MFFTKVLFLALFFANVFVLHPITLSADDKPKQESKIEDHSYNYEEMFSLVRAFLTGPRGDRLQKFFKEVFAEELRIPEDIQREYGFPEELRKLSVQQFIMLLKENPAKWDMLRGIIKNVPAYLDEYDHLNIEKSKEALALMREMIQSEKIKSNFLRLNDPSKPLLLDTRDGTAGFTELQFFGNHKRVDLTGKTHAPDDLVKEMIKIINRPEVKQFTGNFFDFDLMEIAQTLIEAHRKDKEISLGVDNDVVKHRPEVKAVVKAMERAGFLIVDQESEEKLPFKVKEKLREQRKGFNVVYLVNAVGLNHQKMFAVNWDDKATARTYFSSANPTKSGMHKEGDLAGTGLKSKFSVPNANHFATMKSYILAQLVRHQTKMMFELDLRGSELPYSGAFELKGPREEDGTRSRLVITFAPAGGLGNIGKHMISQAIQKTEGPIGMAQFAFSSKSIQESLLARAVKDSVKPYGFNYWGVGDTPFMMMDWSQFLKMVGLQKIVVDSEKHYVPLEKSAWVETLPAQELEKLFQRIRIAPLRYSPFVPFQKPDGSSVTLSGKLHHKIAVFGGAQVISTEESERRPHYRSIDGQYYALSNKGIAVLADSFNFSESAERNTEQMLMFINNKKANNFAWSLIFGLVEDSPRNIIEEAVRRNKRGEKHLNPYMKPYYKKVIEEKKRKIHNKQKNWCSRAF